MTLSKLGGQIFYSVGRGLMGRPRMSNAAEKAGAAIAQVGALNRQKLVSMVGSLILCGSGLAYWQFTGNRNPLVAITTNAAAIGLLGSGRKAKGKLSAATELAGVAKHVATEAEKRRIVVSKMPDAATPRLMSGIGGDVQIALSQQGIETHMLGVIKGPSFLRVQLRLCPGVTVDDISRLAETLKSTLGVSQPPIVSSQADFVAVDLERPDRQFIPIDGHLEKTRGNQPITLPIGVDINNKLKVCKISDPNTCHFLVGGTTGSGKSEFLRAWVRWLMQWSPDRVQILIIDPKKVTFGDLEFKGRLARLAELFDGDSPEERMQRALETFPDKVEADEFAKEFEPWLPVGVVKEDRKAVEVYKSIVEEMFERYKLFDQYGVSNLDEFNEIAARAGCEPLPVLVCITDEYFVQVADGEIKKQTEAQLKPMGAMARAAGICIVIATQRPEMNVLTPLIRSMMVARICLKVSTIPDAEIVLGRDGDVVAGGAYLLGKGDLLAYTGEEIVRYQSLYWDGKSRPSAQDHQLQLLSSAPSAPSAPTSAASTPTPLPAAPIDVDAEAAVIAEELTPEIKTAIEITAETITPEPEPAPAPAPAKSTGQFTNSQRDEIRALLAEIASISESTPKSIASAPTASTAPTAATAATAAKSITPGRKSLVLTGSIGSPKTTETAERSIGGSGSAAGEVGVKGERRGSEEGGAISAPAAPIAPARAVTAVTAVAAEESAETLPAVPIGHETVRHRGTAVAKISELYLKYRAHREGGGAPSYFVAEVYGKDTKGNRAAFDQALDPHLRSWAIELAGSGKTPEQIVGAIWNLTPRDRAGGARFAEKLEWVKSSIDS